MIRTLPEESVHCCVTSPPYFGLRDYGVAGQIGLEPTPDEFVAKLVAVFREVRRVLRDDGTLWLNLGDSYAGYWGDANAKKEGRRSSADTNGWTNGFNMNARPSFHQAFSGTGIKPKDLIGIPWRVAFALQADGWYLRQDIIWHKPNPMPESVRDRCTKAHEYIFLLAKSGRYYFDADAIAEPVAESTVERLTQPTQPTQPTQLGSERVPGKTNGNMKAVARPQLARAIEIAREKGLTPAHIDAIRSAGITDAGKAAITQTGAGRNTEEIIRLAAEAKEALGGYYREFLTHAGGRNKRSVWTVTTKPFKGAHFATFPPDLIEPCILAGCPSDGVVLDPFGGSGTTGMVSHRLGRNAILCELNPEYVEIAKSRIYSDAPLFAEVA